MINALKNKYRADYDIAHANLEIYLRGSVGIGEHPQHFEEMDKIIETMATAKDKLEVLENQYTSAELLEE